MPVISMHFFAVPGVIKLRMLWKFSQKILNNSYYQVTALGICIHIKWIYIIVQRRQIIIIVKGYLNEYKPLYAWDCCFVILLNFRIYMKNLLAIFSFYQLLVNAQVPEYIKTKQQSRSLLCLHSLNYFIISFLKIERKYIGLPLVSNVSG